MALFTTDLFHFFELAFLFASLVLHVGGFKTFFFPAKTDQYEPFLPTGTRNAPAQCAGAGDAADTSCAVGRAQRSDCVQDSPP